MFFQSTPLKLTVRSPLMCAHITDSWMKHFLNGAKSVIGLGKNGMCRVLMVPQRMWWGRVWHQGLMSVLFLALVMSAVHNVRRLATSYIWAHPHLFFSCLQRLQYWRRLESQILSCRWWVLWKCCLNSEETTATEDTTNECLNCFRTSFTGK